jgi:hypothetical protein
MPSFGGKVPCPTLGHVKELSSCGSLRTAGKIRMFSFLLSLIEVSRAAWCGVPLEMKEGTIPIWDTKGLSTRRRCITLIITQLKEVFFSFVVYKKYSHCLLYILCYI